MNPWEIYFVYLILIVCIVITILVSLVLIIRRKHNKKGLKRTLIVLLVASCFLVLLILFIVCHSTYYKYNDWCIMDSNINMVQQKYGDFDLGVVENNKEGVVAYYIYTDNGPIMPDHLKHYYYIKYDVRGVVYSIYEGCQPGG